MREVTHQRGKYAVLERPHEEILDDLRQGWVVTDENVAAAWPQALPDQRRLILPPGEATKCLAVFGQVQEWLAGHGAKRSTRLFVLGGGVLGDLGGFAAATYARGIRYVHVPTTLLAMVDSSVGGKVGIDLPQGKNLVGAFAPPSEVWLSTDWLGTLPRREFLNGTAEVWKIGYIRDLALLEQLRRGPVVPGDSRLKSLIESSIQNKADIVEADEFELTGLRATLNFGHTVGHAIEKALGYKDLFHGEAIAIGMVLEAEIGEQLGITEPGTARAIRRDLASQELPVVLPEGLSSSLLISSMRLDKKSTTTGLAFSLLEGPGQCKLHQDVPESIVREVLDESCAP